MAAGVDRNDSGALTVDMVFSEADRMRTGAAASGVRAAPRTEVAVWLAAILALWVGIGHAEELTGMVIRVADGDTMTILDAAKAHHTIRLKGIDAPERGQPFGTRSRESLSSMVAGRYVTVDWHKRDRYSRLVGQVFADRHDVGLVQIERGMAWHYKAYEREQTVEDARGYAEAENTARAARRGLWADPKPVPPWYYRQARRTQ